MKDILVTTTNSVDGYKVINYIGPVVTNLVIGTSIITEFFAGITDIVGGRSNKYQEKLAEMYDIAIDQLKEAANKKTQTVSLA
jgi:uncharacterized protein YbjQ (UPF0145 family)